MSARLVLAAALACTLFWLAPSVEAQASTPSWVTRSNEHAQVLLDVIARFSPEGASAIGMEGYDEQVHDLLPKHVEREQAALKGASNELKKRLAKEQDPLVREDLEILIKEANKNIKGLALHQKYELPYYKVHESIFRGMKVLLDDQVAPARRQLALNRLKRYAGLVPGSEPLSKLAEARTREALGKAKLLGPAKAEVEKDLANASFFVQGIAELLKRFSVQGADESFFALKTQLGEYEAFVRSEVLPRARSDFRLPRELYAFELVNVGVDIAPEKLAKLAHAAFLDIQKEMQALVPEVLAQHKLTGVTDYRDVIRALKKDQLVGDAILPHYQARLAELENIIRTQHLLTLPARPARIRLASEAESAGVPAPHMRPPRLLGNTGEVGEFVLPLRVPAKPGSKQALEQFDDFTFAAASWTLTAHEVRPGHELQFAQLVEHGVSTARGIFAFNSVNVEGWGLYAESISLPFMPPDGRLISLQHRLMRAARAFLDPELQAGKLTPEEAHHVITNDVVLSDAMATQEVERYTFRSPAQATSYFYGYTRLNSLRSEVEQKLKGRFDAQRFHDFVLAQGLLPPDLLRKSVLSTFVPAEAKAEVKAGNAGTLKGAP
jgi:hypothetical protein